MCTRWGKTSLRLLMTMFDSDARGRVRVDGCVFMHAHTVQSTVGNYCVIEIPSITTLHLIVWTEYRVLFVTQE